MLLSSKTSVGAGGGGASEGAGLSEACGHLCTKWVSAKRANILETSLQSTVLPSGGGKMTAGLGASPLGGEATAFGAL